MEKGYTAMLLEAFIEGMKEAGADVNLLYASHLDVKDCTGEFHCWYKTPGECYIRDDMQAVYPRLKEADILVLGIPMYVPVPATMQAVLNRMCPILEPVLETREGRTRARLFPDVNIRSFVLVSTSGWWEIENMDTLVRIVRELADDAGVRFGGAVLRPHAQEMGEPGEPNEKGRSVLVAAKRVGRMLISEGSMHFSMLEEVSRIVLSKLTFHEEKDGKPVPGPQRISFVIEGTLALETFFPAEAYGHLASILEAPIAAALKEN